MSNEAPYSTEFLLKVQAAVDGHEDEKVRKFAHSEMSKAYAAGRLRAWYEECYS